MVDRTKHIEYWRNSAKEDWRVADKLINDGDCRHGLFFAHLALEKVLKALVCQKTRDVAPRIHNLVRLAELTALEFEDHRIDLLAEMNQFNIEGRYPEYHAPAPQPEEAINYLKRSEEVMSWLTKQF